MGEIIMRASRSALPADLLEAMRAELDACGLTGIFAIGPTTGHRT